MRVIYGLAAVGFFCQQLATTTTTALDLQVLSTYKSGIFAGSAAEIVAYDSSTRRLFVTNNKNSAVDVLDASNVGIGVLPRVAQIPIPNSGGPNSVAVSPTGKSRVIAVAIDAPVLTDPGRVDFFRASTSSSGSGVFTFSLIRSITVGSLPDMVTYTPDGKYVLVANEGSPEGSAIDPEGSIAIIDVSSTNSNDWSVRTASFQPYNSQIDVLKQRDVRIFPNKTVSQDLEPEYIAVDASSRTAYVTLQEANALAVVDIATATVTKILPLGFKNHLVSGLDASDRDSKINIAKWPVFGMYMPDAIAAFEVNGKTYLATANEGDARTETKRVSEVTLDPVTFPNAASLKLNENLGRLDISVLGGDRDNDGDYDVLYSYGTRSFSIWDTSGQLVFDSGDEFEQITAKAYPNDFNANNEANGSFDNRSDNKGPEPEAITVGMIRRKLYAFIGLERIGGIMVYDISNPQRPSFVKYVNNRIFTGNATIGTAGDLGVESLVFIPATDSPTGIPLLVAGNEVSGTTTVFQVVLPPCDSQCQGENFALDVVDFFLKLIKLIFSIF